MNKKKGFTLVELLAVIVILAIIALIATPIILNVINDAKKQAALESFKGYIDGAEKTIVLNEFEDEKDTTFPEADDNGCYNLNDLDKKINVKGTKPNIDSGAKVCFENGVVTNITGLSFNGYKVEYKSGKYLINGKEVEKDDKKDLIGIPSKEYTTGDKLGVEYLGHKWIVMKDNGNNTQLVMDGYLSADELKAYLPSDVEKSDALYGNSYRIKMCLEKSSKYCTYAYGNSDNNYSWNTSIIKPTIENWLNNKMTEKGLEKEKELKGMSFTDGVDTINSYVRIPVYDEVKTLYKYCDEKGPYCADNNEYMYSNYNYWVLTRKNSENAYFFTLYKKADGNVLGGGLYTHHVSTDAPVRPVITVNEK